MAGDSPASPRADYVLGDEQTLPIVVWLGPSDDQIRPEVMAALAGAGFNISVSAVAPEQFDRALGIAADAGMRLLVRSAAFDLGRMTYEQGRDYSLDDAQKARIRDAVGALRDHPGLYGYYIHDEPAHADYDWIAAVIREIESHDSYHMCYVNHNAPVIQGGYGAGTQEALWKDWIRKTRPRYLSYDHYPIELKPRDVIAGLGAQAPNVFGSIVVKPNYFACLAFARMFCTVLDLPLWAFTNAVAHWSYPPATAGHLRFQLMCDLAYGARGLQYFVGGSPAVLVDGQGRTTDTWAIARQVNAEVQRLWQHLRPLRSIGVFHHGPVWEGTQRHMLTPVEAWGMDHLGPKFHCLGDPCVLGLFDDPAGAMFVLVVNRNPQDSASVSLDPTLADTVPHKWHPLPRGGAKLFRLRDGAPPEAVA